MLVTRLPSLFALSLAATLSLAASAHAEPRYYLTLYSSENKPLARPRAHCFAHFAKVEENATGEGSKVLETQVISWYPASGVVRFLRGPEPGVNVSLEETFRRCRESDLNVHQWGPVAIEPELYRRAVEQVEMLESGSVGWKGFDRSSRRQGTAINCIHSISDIDRESGRLSTGTASGTRAAERIVLHLSRWYLPTPESPTWLVRELNLDRVTTHQRTVPMPSRSVASR